MAGNVLRAHPALSVRGMELAMKQSCVALASSLSVAPPPVRPAAAASIPSLKAHRNVRNVVPVSFATVGPVLQSRVWLALSRTLLEECPLAMPAHRASTPL